MKVSVIGTGNVGSQFARIFNTRTLSSRKLDGLPKDSDLYIISVSDNAVPEVAKNMPEVDGIVVHTTGSVAMEVLSTIKCKGYGVLYPFQTISKMRPLPPSSIPLLIEGDSSATLGFIRTAAEKYGFIDIAEADSDMRRKVHLAGAFSCNFVNAMVGIGQEILSKCGIQPEIIGPLVEETVEKLKTMPARDAQTGPAVRKDTPTLDKHIRLLSDLEMTDEAEIYRAVSDYIIRISKS